MGRLKLTYQTRKSNTKSSILLTCSLLLLLHQRQLRCRLKVMHRWKSRGLTSKLTYLTITA